MYVIFKMGVYVFVKFSFFVNEVGFVDVDEEMFWYKKWKNVWSVGDVFSLFMFKMVVVIMV